jgi:hypothetical protein
LQFWQPSGFNYLKDSIIATCRSQIIEFIRNTLLWQIELLCPSFEVSFLPYNLVLFGRLSNTLFCKIKYLYFAILNVTLGFHDSKSLLAFRSTIFSSQFIGMSHSINMTSKSWIIFCNQGRCIHESYFLQKRTSTENNMIIIINFLFSNVDLRFRTYSVALFWHYKDKVNKFILVLYFLPFSTLIENTLSLECTQKLRNTTVHFWFMEDVSILHIRTNYKELFILISNYHL